uniref:Uncharacterized protein n=1 Tax=Timema monikensis TaxID=170555 RepID=A0A7R9E669_9NEOP|nr:unnamed protein product [Timema monikensis]
MSNKRGSVFSEYRCMVYSSNDEVTFRKFNTVPQRPFNLFWVLSGILTDTAYDMDMDLIEVLWKQDVDLGFSLDLFTPPKSPKLDEKLDKEHEPQDELEKLKALQASAAATEDADKNEDDILPTQDLDPWEGLPYTIDLETVVAAAASPVHLEQPSTTDYLTSGEVIVPRVMTSQKLGYYTDITWAQS